MSTTAISEFDAAWKACKIPHSLALRACNWSCHSDMLPKVRTILCRHLQKQGYKLETIARIMGAGDHTSVLHALRREDPETVPQEPSQHLADAMRACGISEAWLPKVRDWTESNDPDVMEMREDLVAWLRDNAGLSWPSIARAMGAKSHTAAMKAYERAKERA